MTDRLLLQIDCCQRIMNTDVLHDMTFCFVIGQYLSFMLYGSKSTPLFRNYAKHIYPVVVLFWCLRKLFQSTLLFTKYSAYIAIHSIISYYIPTTLLSYPVHLKKSSHLKKFSQLINRSVYVAISSVITYYIPVILFL